MENKVSYVLVGLFVVIFTILSILLGIWISAYKNTKEYLTYAVYFQEAVSGLSEQSNVKFNGVPVGYVQRIELDPNNVKNVRLLLSIEKQVPVTITTSATLKAQGLTGITYVELKAEDASTQLLKAQYGQTYPVIKSKPSLLVQLDTTLREVTQNLRKIGDSFHDVFDQDNIDALHTSLHSIAKISKSVADRSQEIDNSFKNMDKILARTEKLSQHFPEMSDKFMATLEHADKFSERLSATGEEALQLFKSAKTNLNSLSAQLMPNLHQVMTHMNSISNNMAQVSEQLKYDPSILVRGRKHAKKGAK